MGVWVLADSLVFVLGICLNSQKLLFLREYGWGSNTVYPNVQTELVSRLLDIED